MSPPPTSPAHAHGSSNRSILAALLLGVLLHALDQTIVGTSLGKIAADIGGFEHFAWLFAAYMLGSTTVIPLAGKFSDIYGRRPVYLIGLGVFLVGSALCGMAGSMTELILYRAVQGLGGGALLPVALATIADLYPPSERGRVQASFGAVFGFASVTGPFLGGWIVDNLHLFGVTSWRWVFYVNVPVGALALVMVSLHFPRGGTRSAKPIDWLGIVTLTTALVAGLLTTVWGGEQYAWSSPQILSLLALSIGSFGLFLHAERRAADPVVPLGLFREPVFLVAAVATLLMGVGMFGVVSFMPTFMQAVVGVSATYAGAVLTPLMLGLVAGSVVSGRLMTRVGYKPFMLAGTTMAAAGFIALSRLGTEPSLTLAVLDMVVVGLGLGFTIQTYVVAVQNVVAREHVGTATSTITLLRSLGGTIGVTGLGVLLNRALRERLPEHVPAPALHAILADPFIEGRLGRVPSLLLRPEFTESAPAAVVEGIRVAFATSVTTVFLGGAVLSALALAVSVLMRVHALKGRDAPAPPAEAAVADAPARS